MEDQGRSRVIVDLGFGGRAGQQHGTVLTIQNNIVNAERRGKRQVMIRPSSKVVVKVLAVMQKHGKLPLLSLTFTPIPTFTYNSS